MSTPRPPSLASIPRDDPEEALRVLVARHAAGVLRYADLDIAAKLQSADEPLYSMIRAAGLVPNDPNDS